MDSNKLGYLKQKRILLQKEIRLKKMRHRINSELKGSNYWGAIFKRKYEKRFANNVYKK
jgi:hypothetical protein